MAGKEKELLTNWSANITYTSDVVHEATSIAEIQELLKSNPKVKPFGIRYDKLCPYLHDRGFALSNLPSITELSVVGACSTGAHGSGDKCGSLAIAVSALEIVTGDGEVVKLSRDADGDAVFAGAVVGLGALGVVTKLTLDVEPQFTMRQWVYEGLPMEELTEHFEEIMACGYSVSLCSKVAGGTSAPDSQLQMWESRGRLQSFVAALSDDEVQAASQKAFAALPSLKDSINVLSKLKGVGPATASAVPTPRPSCRIRLWWLR